MVALGITVLKPPHLNLTTISSVLEHVAPKHEDLLAQWNGDVYHQLIFSLTYPEHSFR